MTDDQIRDYIDTRVSEHIAALVDAVNSVVGHAYRVEHTLADLIEAVDRLKAHVLDMD